MLKVVGLIAALLVSAVLGAALGPIVLDLTDGLPKGRAVACAAHGKLCVGERLKPMDVDLWRGPLGGLISVDCDYIKPGQGLVSGGRRDALAIAMEKCDGPRIVLGFSNGVRLTNLWVEDGVIRQVDRYALYLPSL